MCTSHFIDDATSRILYAEFVTVENTFNFMSTTTQYLLAHGRPVALYVDKDSIYTVNRQASVEEQLKDEQGMTQYARAMSELGIEIILANSPQAKGRIERSFGTHQDRLVKELRLAGISTIKAANIFLKTAYIQILPDQKIRLRPKAKIIVQERLNGSLHLKFKGLFLNFKPLPQRPYKPYYGDTRNPLNGTPESQFLHPIPLRQNQWRNSGISAKLLVSNQSAHKQR